MSHVDVVIVNYRSAAYTAACVGAVHRVAQGDGVAANVIVVNNSGGAPDLEAQVGARGPADFVHNTSNLGFGAACNIGAARGAAPLILFLNPDAVLKPGYFQAAAAFMNDPANRQVGILGPAIEREDGAVSETSADLPSFASLMTRTLGLSRAFLPAGRHARSGPVGQVMGAALLIRRPLFRDLAGFDPRFFLYYEDVDLCARAASRGAATYYLTAARAAHIGRVSSSHDTGMALALFLRSRFTYARLHFGVIAQALLILASYLGELPLRLLRTLFGGKSITGLAVLRAYRLLSINLISGTSLVTLGARER
ncbi:MAG: glycosyltransferase family 2 protein [Rhodospirillaceae bacterium]